MKQLIFVCWLLSFPGLCQNNLVLTEEKQGILAFYQQNPLDINQVEESELTALGILETSQIKAFLMHRIQIGRFLSIYELQSIPWWDLNTCRLMESLLVCKQKIPTWYTPSNPQHQIITRMERTLEEKKGFSEPSTRSKVRYLGNPWNHLLRYRGSWNSYVRGGLLLAKDAGEPNNFDFYSAFLEIKDPIGRYKLILGDFINQWGQGLIQSGSFSLGKSYESIRATQKFHGGGLPYTSSGESEFYRGISLQHSLGSIQSQLFLSIRKKDLILAKDSSFFRSFQLDGLHRTPTEISQKNRLNEKAAGVNIRYIQPHFDLTLSHTWTNWNYVYRPSEPLDWSGRNLSNSSLSYLWQHGNKRFSVELAHTNFSAWAIIQAFSIATTQKTDFSSIVRYYQAGYFSPMANAFRESSTNKNEIGLYIGHQYQLNKYRRLSSYIDLFRFPSETSSRWVSNKLGFELLSRYQWDRRKLGQYFLQVKWTQKVREDAKFNLYQASLDWNKKYRFLEWHGRIMWAHIRAGNQIESGYLYLHDFDFHRQRFQIQVRNAWIWSASYDTRLYAYEPSLRFSFLLPAYYDPSIRNVLLLEYKVSKQMSLGLKIARTDFFQKDEIGSGLDAIPKSHKSDVGIQFIYSP